ncbi:MAG: hypothetical protein A2Y73_05510 [Chloroflexi bacterium RBG_13_56_8]|nr:MAG: hypothetical protein A2Y73_05510 [Chloroflexi bacterium RBG_13_56_8]
MAKSISVTWSEGVNEQEWKILANVIDQTLKWLYLHHPLALMDPPLQTRIFGNWIIPILAPDRPYWGTQWYIDTSYNDELQRVIAPTFLELVRREPWQQQNPHFDLALLDQDLTDFPVPLAKLRPDHYCLGTSLPGTTAVMSVHQIRTLPDEHIRELALARLVRHHLGHVLGIPQFTRKEGTTRLGLEMHCTETCAMRHVATVEQLAELAREEAEMNWPFCEHCTQELLSIVVRNVYDWS